ncbi:hypothetical protein Tco_1403445 [Tanacetum coccineum]
MHTQDGMVKQYLPQNIDAVNTRWNLNHHGMKFIDLFPLENHFLRRSRFGLSLPKGNLFNVNIDKACAVSRKAFLRVGEPEMQRNHTTTNRHKKEERSTFTENILGDAVGVESFGG